MITLIVLGVRTSLLESEDNECPDCHEKDISPGTLIPNRYLRNSVNTFKNDTGYQPYHDSSNYADKKKVILCVFFPENSYEKISSVFVSSEI